MRFQDVALFGVVAIAAGVVGLVVVMGMGRKGATPARSQTAKTSAKSSTPETDNRPLAEVHKERLQGVWQIVYFRHGNNSWDLRTLPNAPVSDRENWIIFRDNKIYLRGARVNADDSTFKLDPTTTPATITIITLTHGGDSFTGVYRLQRDKLKLCVGNVGNDPPRDFGEGDDDNLHFELERLKGAEEEQPREMSERQKRWHYIWKLIDQGEKALKKDKANARFPLELAHYYSANDTRIPSTAELPPLKMTETETERMKLLLPQLELADFEDWPSQTPEDEMTELRLLADDRLIGKLRYFAMTPQGSDGRKGHPVLFFLGTPQLRRDVLLATYGKPPQPEKMLVKGGTALTYGRIRLMLNPANEVVAVFYAADLK